MFTDSILFIICKSIFPNSIVYNIAPYHIWIVFVSEILIFHSRPLVLTVYNVYTLFLYLLKVVVRLPSNQYSTNESNNK